MGVRQKYDTYRISKTPMGRFIQHTVAAIFQREEKSPKRRVPPGAYRFGKCYLLYSRETHFAGSLRVTRARTTSNAQPAITIRATTDY